mmetsp:Transcript_35003/g.72891  ORF Transcript_35003/g.72891 Transcript_35003/m.72891 type:complete len:235 (-) Transcript_35003:132-836(-)
MTIACTVMPKEARWTLLNSTIHQVFLPCLHITNKFNQFGFFSWKTHHFHVESDDGVTRNTRLTSRSRTSLATKRQFTRNGQDPSISDSHGGQDGFDSLEQTTAADTGIIRFGGFKNIINLEIIGVGGKSNGRQFSNIGFGSITGLDHLVRHTIGESRDIVFRSGGQGHGTHNGGSHGGLDEGAHKLFARGHIGFCGSESRRRSGADRRRYPCLCAGGQGEKRKSLEHFSLSLFL